MNKRKFLIFLCIFTFFGRPLCAAEKMTVLLDWFVNPDHGPLIIAQENGYFADQGLEVIASMPKLVAAGQADIAISYQPQYLQLRNSSGQVTPCLFWKKVRKNTPV